MLKGRTNVGRIKPLKTEKADSVYSEVKNKKK